MWRCDRRPTMGGGGQRAVREELRRSQAGWQARLGPREQRGSRSPTIPTKPGRHVGLVPREMKTRRQVLSPGTWHRAAGGGRGDGPGQRRRWLGRREPRRGTAGGTWRGGRPQGGKGQSDGDGAFVCGPGAWRRVDVYRAGEGVGRVGETMVRIQTPFPQSGRRSARRHTSLLRLSCRSADTHGRHGRGEGASPTPGIRGSPGLLPHRTPTPGVCTYRSAYLPLPP